MYFNSFIKTASIILIFLLLIRMIFTDTTTGNNIIRNNDHFSEDSMIETTMNLLRTCFINNLNMFVFVGEYRHFLNWYKKVPSALLMYVLGISNSKIFAKHKRLTSSFKLDKYVISRLRYPSKMFMISYETESLYARKIEKILRRSVLWNSRAIFFVVNDSPEDRCSNASSAFVKAWNYNILHVIYVCCNEKGFVQYYTFNPFTSLYSGSWEISEIVNASNIKTSHLMTIFKYSGNLNAIDSSTCDNFIFDKTSVLNDYPITTCSSVKPYMFDYNNHSLVNETRSIPLNEFGGMDANLVRIVWTKLRTTPRVDVYSTKGFVDDQNNPQGVIAILTNYRCDMGDNEQYLRAFWRLQTYPHDITSMCAVTPRRVQATGGTPMLQIFKPKVLFLIILAHVLATCILKCVLNVDYITATLEVMRALLGMSTIFEPKSLSDRFIFIYIILIIFHLNAYFSCQLTSFYSTKQEDTNVNTEEDLIESNYSILGEKYFKEFLQKDILRERFNEFKLENCMRSILHNKKVACLCDCFEPENLAATQTDLDIHVSNAFYDSHVSYIVREDWPLLDRVNQIIQALREGGIVNFEDDRVFYIIESDYKALRLDFQQQDDDENFVGSPLKFGKLMYSFSFLVVGLLASVVLFITEYISGKSEDRLVPHRRVEQLKILQQTRLFVWDYYD